MERKTTPPSVRSRASATPPRGRGTLRDARAGGSDHSGAPQKPKAWQAANTARGTSTSFTHPPLSAREGRQEGPADSRRRDTLTPRQRGGRGPTVRPTQEGRQAWQTLCDGPAPLLIQSGSAQAPQFQFSQRSDPKAQHGLIAEACAAAWDQSPAQGLALLGAVCQGLDAPVLWARLLQAHAKQLLDAAATLGAPALRPVLAAIAWLAERGWCDPEGGVHVQAAARQARQALQSLAALHDAPLSRRLALAEIQQRQQRPDQGSLSDQERLDLLRRLHELCGKALSAQELALAQRLWAVSERLAQGLPAEPTGLNALSQALARDLRKAITQALQPALSAGLGPWIRIELQPPQAPEHSALAGIQLQPLPEAEAQAAALAECLAWLQTQLRLPPARRLLDWADLQRLIGAVAPALNWRPTPAQQLDWCLLQAVHAHEAQPLCEWLGSAQADEIDAAELGTVLTLARNQALPRSERMELLRLALPLLPAPDSAPDLHAQYRRALDAIGEPGLRERLLQRHATRFDLVPQLDRPQTQASGQPRQPAQAEPRPAQTLARWLSIENRLDASGQPLYLLARPQRGAQAPQDEDEFQLAQSAFFNWMTQELDRPDGAGWTQLVDLVGDIEALWPWKFDRLHLLALCLWHVERSKNPAPLLQLLPQLAGESNKHPILAALLEQARQPRWSPLIRASLLQTSVQWLPELTPGSDGLHAQALQTVLEQADEGVRASLLALYRQRHPLEAGSETWALLRALQERDPGPEAPPEALLAWLDSVRQRERRAPRERWLGLCRLMIERATPRLLVLLRSDDRPLAARAADALQGLIWRMAHPESGDKAMAVDDQFALLQSWASALPAEHAQAAIEALDQACQRLIHRALQPRKAEVAPRLPMAALAMRGALTVLSAPHQPRAPMRPSPLGLPLADALGHFFADWFRALHASASPTVKAQAPDLEMSRLFHLSVLFEQREQRLAQPAIAFLSALFKQHGLNPG